MHARNRKEITEMMLVHGIVVAIVFIGFIGVVSAQVLLNLA